MTTDARIVWHGPRFERLVREVAARKLNKVTAALHTRIVDNISQPTRTHGPSLPKGFPHANTGRLRQSIYIQLATPDNLEGRVGTNLDYGGYLEIGTKKMTARSYLRRTLREMRSELRRTFNNG